MKQIIVKDMRGAHYPMGESFIANYPGIIKLAEAFYKIPEYEDSTINFIGSGSSGIILATMFASLQPHRSFIVAVKKERESSNHPNYDMRLHGCVNVIVDDFVKTGKTLNYIYSELISNISNDIHIHAICTQGYSRMERLKFTADYVLSMGTEF